MSINASISSSAIPVTSSSYIDLNSAIAIKPTTARKGSSAAMARIADLIQCQTFICTENAWTPKRPPSPTILINRLYVTPLTTPTPARPVSPSTITVKITSPGLSVGHTCSRQNITTPSAISNSTGRHRIFQNALSAEKRKPKRILFNEVFTA